MMRGDASIWAGRRLGLTLAAGATLLLGAACSDDNDARTVANDNNTARQQDVQDLRFEVKESSVTPSQVRLQTGTSYKVIVKNTGSAECSFYIGEYMKDFRVAAGAEQSLGVEVPGSPTGNQGGGQSAKMGCAGDGAREGNVDVINLTGAGSGGGGGAGPGGGAGQGGGPGTGTGGGAGTTSGTPTR